VLLAFSMQLFALELLQCRY